MINFNDMTNQQEDEKPNKGCLGDESTSPAYKGLLGEIKTLGQDDEETGLFSYKGFLGKF